VAGMTPYLFLAKCQAENLTDLTKYRQKRKALIYHLDKISLLLQEYLKNKRGVSLLANVFIFKAMGGGRALYLNLLFS